MGDATLDFLASLDRPELWHTDEVPVFVPHEREKSVPGGGKIRVKVTEADLHTIARRANDREAQTGTLAVVTLGHRRPERDVPETEQPPVVGYARKWRVGRFGPKKLPCLYCTRYIRREEWDEAKRFPFRSVDFYPSKGEITGLALLKRDPELDMGMVAYHDGAVLLYSREVNMPDLPDPTKPPMADEPDEGYAQFEGHVAKHPVLSYVCSKYEGEAMGGGAPAVPGPESASLPAPAPGGGLPPPAPDMTPMQRDQVAIEYARSQRENTALRDELAGLRREVAQKDSEALVSQLQAEGYLLDKAEEVQYMAGLHKPARDARAASIRKNYRRDPTAGPLLPVGGRSERETSPTRKNAADFVDADLAKATQYMKEHPGCDWHDAEQYARGERTLAGRVLSNGR